MQRAKDAIRGLYPAGPLEAADPHDSSAWRWHVPTTGTRYFIPTDDPKERHEERPAAADRRSWRRPEAHALSSFNLSSAHQHRAEKLGAVSERIDLWVVAERDRWRCGICGKRVGQMTTGRRSASLDHIVPLARGGQNLYVNVQLVHLVCNWSKHDRDTLPSQLRLAP